MGNCPQKWLYVACFSLLEVSVEQSLKCLSVARLILSHLVNGVVDSVKVVLLCHLGEVELALSSAVLSGGTLGEILLGGRGNYLSEHFSELSGVLCLFPCCLLVVQSDLGITLSVSCSCHSEVHTDLGALAVEVSAKPLDDLIGNTLGYADLMLACDNQLALALCYSLELVAAGMALRTFIGSLFSNINITADCTYILHN